MENDTNTIFLIDYGIADFYKDHETGRHIKMKEMQNFKGTLRFASSNSHNKVTLSRRDDLVSLAYMIIHLCKDGGLPWNPRMQE